MTEPKIKIYKSKFSIVTVIDPGLVNEGTNPVWINLMPTERLDKGDICLAGMQMVHNTTPSDIKFEDYQKDVTDLVLVAVERDGELCLVE